MNDLQDLRILLQSHIPIVTIESHEEHRVSGLFSQLGLQLVKPTHGWSVTKGLHRLDLSPNFSEPEEESREPAKALREIRDNPSASIYILLDFHPYLKDPMNVRLLKEIALAYDETPHTIVLLSHAVTIPGELSRFSAQFQLALPDADALRDIVQEVARKWAKEHGQRVRTDRKSLDLLINNLQGLSAADARRLAHNAIYNDGAITPNDLPRVTQAKYEMIDMEGVLSFEYETAQFSEVGGLEGLKRWLDQRRAVFRGEHRSKGLDAPKGIMLLGVQGGGKSLAAKAVAGAWGIPLLRLDFGALYNKYHGETERNLRQSLKISEMMSPCVLWLDEIEKGVASGGEEDGTSRRVLGTLLTWMSERKEAVFMVATANDISALPPELIRKGRLDEIFFVDLPSGQARAEIFAIHLKKREINLKNFNIKALANASTGYSGAEIEQAIVAGLYSALGQDKALNEQHLLEEISRTRPLSVVMAEKITALRAWAQTRTVLAN